MDVDQIWKALSDATRREILDLVRERPRTTTEIVEAFPGLSRFGVMKHLEVLKRCGLVLVREEGRRRYNSINVVPLRLAYDRWMRKYEEAWANTLFSIKQAAETPTEDGPDGPPPRDVTSG